MRRAGHQVCSRQRRRRRRRFRRRSWAKDHRSERHSNSELLTDALRARLDYGLFRNGV